jgi:hypothetical protein
LILEDETFFFFMLLGNEGFFDAMQDIIQRLLCLAQGDPIPPDPHLHRGEFPFSVDDLDFLDARGEYLLDDAMKCSNESILKHLRTVSVQVLTLDSNCPHARINVPCRIF